MATKKSTRVNKSAFVRLHPNTPPREVVALAKASGISFDEKYVHNVRWKDAKFGVSVRGAKKLGRPKGSKNSVSQPRVRRPRVVIEAANLSEQFCTIAMDLGLVKATALLGQIRQAAQTLTMPGQ
jgi:hypothetical protein